MEILRGQASARPLHAIGGGRQPERHKSRQSRWAGGVPGQAAVEVLAYASFFLLVFAALSAVFLQMQAQELGRAESVYAQEIAYSFSDHVRTAFIAGSGFEQNIAVPPRLLGKEYLIRISSAVQQGLGEEIRETGFIYVEWQGSADRASFSAPALAPIFQAKYDGQVVSQEQLTGFIVINPSRGTRLKMSNVEQGGNSVILIEKG